MKMLNVNQMEKIQGGEWLNWVPAFATCAIGINTTVQTGWSLAEVAIGACTA